MRAWTRSSTGRISCAALAMAALVTVVQPARAGAADEPGVNSRVVGRGDIVTSILGWARSTRRSGTSSTPPACSWRTLNDAQLEWLVSVGAEAVGLGFDTPLLDPLRAHLGGEPLPDGDLQGYVCGVETQELRFLPTSSPRDIHRRIHRRMITHLPAPNPHTSPPADVAVPVNHPVFFWIDPQQWSPVEATLREGSIVAQVRARPVSMRVFTGDPRSTPISCDGPGLRFDDSSVLSVWDQAALDDACTTTYLTASAGRRSGRSLTSEDRRPDVWLGTVTVIWRAEWRVGDGAWMDLGSIPRTRLMTRTSRDVSTSIETAGG